MLKSGELNGLVNPNADATHPPRIRVGTILHSTIYLSGEEAEKEHVQQQRAILSALHTQWRM